MSDVKIALRIVASVFGQAVHTGAAAFFSKMSDAGIAIFRWADPRCTAALDRADACMAEFKALDRRSSP